MNKPSVTIGITTYNAGETIREALESALNQSVDIAQIIVVDDRSDDDTMTILGKFASCPSLEVYQNSINSGVATSRNRIIKYAKGEFVAFFDDDDISLPDRIEKQLARILDYERDFAKGSPVICHTARKQIYPNGLERIESTMGCRLGSVAPAGSAVARRALMGDPLKDGYGSCATCSQMGRTGMYRMLGGFDESFRRCEDAELAIRLALAGGHFVGVPEPLVVQKMTPTSEKTLELLRYYTLMMLEKHHGFFDHEGLYQFCREWIEVKFDWLGREQISFTRRLIKLAMRHPFATLYRIRMAMPNFVLNRVFSHFCQNMG